RARECRGGGRTVRRQVVSVQTSTPKGVPFRGNVARVALIAGLQRGKCIADLLCGGIMPSREVIRPYDCNKWHARHAKQSQLVGAQVDVGKSLAANRGSKSKLSPRMDGEQKKS